LRGPTIMKGDWLVNSNLAATTILQNPNKIWVGCWKASPFMDPVALA
jgi:hypothetical protein